MTKGNKIAAKRSLHSGYGLIALACIAHTTLGDPVPDPFPPPAGGKETAPSAKPSPAALEKVPEAKWPRYKKAKDFSPRFTKPSDVWKTKGGHFIAFDAGEWGGALYWLADGETTPSSLCQDAIKDIRVFDGKTLLALGGMQHMDGIGYVYLLQSNPKSQKWQARKAVQCPGEIPWVTGLKEGDGIFGPETHMLVQLGSKQVIGITKSGTVLLSPP